MEYACNACYVTVNAAYAACDASLIASGVGLKPDPADPKYTAVVNGAATFNKPLYQLDVSSWNIRAFCAGADLKCYDIGELAGPQRRRERAQCAHAAWGRMAGLVGQEAGGPRQACTCSRLPPRCHRHAMRSPHAPPCRTLAARSQLQCVQVS